MAVYQYDTVVDPINGSSNGVRPQSAGSSSTTTGRRKQFMDRMKDAGDTEGLLRKNNRRSLGMRSSSNDADELEHDQDYLDHVRSIQVTPVQQQQARQDALERASLASQGSSSSDEARTRPSFDSVGIHSVASASSSRSQPANIRTRSRQAAAPAVGTPTAAAHHQHHQHHHQHPPPPPRPLPAATHETTAIPAGAAPSSPKSLANGSTRTKRSRQRPSKEGGFARSIASSSMLSPPPSFMSQATTSSSYSAASTDYNPLTYRPKDAVRTYRASETLRPVRDSSSSTSRNSPTAFPAPLAPSYHPTIPVSHLARSYAEEIDSSVGSLSPNGGVPDSFRASSASIPRGMSSQTLKGSRAPPPTTGMNTPTTSVAWSDTDYHLENGRITVDQQSEPGAYLPTLQQPERHRNSTHGPLFNSEAMERNVSNLSRGWEKAKLDVRFGLFRTKQKFRRGLG